MLSNPCLPSINVSVSVADVQCAPTVAALGGDTSGCEMYPGNSAILHPSICNANADWLQVLGPDPAQPIGDGFFCSLWAIDQNGGHNT